MCDRYHLLSKPQSIIVTSAVASLSTKRASEAGNAERALARRRRKVNGSFAVVIAPPARGALREIVRTAPARRHAMRVSAGAVADVRRPSIMVRHLAAAALKA